MDFENFFMINLPLGLKRSASGTWFVFNSDYQPLGWNTKKHSETIHNDIPFSQFSIHTKYDNVTEEILLKIAGNEDMLGRDKDGKINLIYLYDSRSNPSKNPIGWDAYFEKIKLLSSLKIK